MAEGRSGLIEARILLGVTGGIAAYKAPELVRLLSKEGALVSVILTRNARRFVTRDALRAVTRGPVLGNLFEAEALGDGPWFPDTPRSSLGMAHIGMAREADLFLVAPAMNVAMWEHVAVRENVRILRERGVRFADPEEGELADGEWGMGRMASLDAILAAVRRALSSARTAPDARAVKAPSGSPPGPLNPTHDRLPLLGRTLVVTAGGTEEPIDPVRVITNRSSGKMGFALAEEARAMGATVTLIVARTSAPAPEGPKIEALTGDAMARAVRAAMPHADALVMAAAVSDFAPAAPSDSKLKRRERGMTLELKSTPDILAAIREEFPKKLLVGFALETEEEERGGMEKLKKKGLDLIAINNPLKAGSAFGSDQNEVILLDSQGEIERIGLRPKRDVARAILLRMARALEAAVAR